MRKRIKKLLDLRRDLIYKGHMNMTQNTEDFLTAKQLEHRLEISPGTLVNWRAANNSSNVPAIPCVQTDLRKGAGFLVRFPKTAVEHWLQQFKPDIAYKINNHCTCKHCRKMEGIAEIVEKQHQKLQNRDINLTIQKNLAEQEVEQILKSA